MNPNTHFYLYAKNHYKKQEIIQDLMLITANYAGIPNDLVRPSDVVTVLSGVVRQEIERGEIKEGMTLENVVEQIVSNNSKDDIYQNVCKALLTVLALARIKGLDLGEPDPNILPINKY